MVVKNWLIMGAAILYLAGAVQELYAGRWPMSILFGCYGISNIILAVI